MKMKVEGGFCTEAACREVWTEVGSEMAWLQGHLGL